MLQFMCSWQHGGGLVPHAAVGWSGSASMENPVGKGDWGICVRVNVSPCSYKMGKFPARKFYVLC